MPRIFPACCLLLVALACLPVAARPRVELSIVDREDGRWLPQYRHAGEHWLAGIPGHRYAVRLANTSDERVLVVLSVDGINAVTGEDADPTQAGYVLGPWQSAEIGGWRKSLEDVAQFHFTALPDSYAARTGRPDNVGVIGIAVFGERRRPAMVRPLPRPGPPPRPLAQARAAAADVQAAPEDTMATDGDAARQRIGTGHGAREWAPVARTGFERAAPHPVQVTELRYDTPQRLIALGILPPPAGQAWPPAGGPRAFPGGFVPDPR